MLVKSSVRNGKVGQSKFIKRLVEVVVVMELRCTHCNYKWNTSSKMDMVSCPNCTRKTKSSKLLKDLDRIQPKNMNKLLMRFEDNE